MHILIIPVWYPNPDNPIAGSFFAEQAAALAGAGHRVSVLPYFRDAKKGAYTHTVVRNENLSEYEIHYRNHRLHLTKLRILLQMLRVCRRELRGSKPDIIHAHNFGALYYALPLGKILGVPVVVTEHVSWFERGILSEKELRSVRRLYSSADAVFAVSEGLRRLIVPLCPGKTVEVVPNLYDERFFRPKEQTPTPPLRFIAVGALVPYKGMDLLLDAFAAVRTEYAETELTICGDGPEKQRLQEQAEKLRISDAVRFTGRISRDEVAKEMRAHHTFVLPGRVETFGVVFLEAMASGLPIVMTKSGAWQELAHPETGIAVEIDDLSALTEAMLHMIKCRSDYDPEIISSYCHDNFSGKAVAEKLTGHYLKLLQDR